MCEKKKTTKTFEIWSVEFSSSDQRGSKIEPLGRLHKGNDKIRKELKRKERGKRGEKDRSRQKKEEEREMT